MIDKGVYFLEILLLSCDRFDDGRDFSKQCIIDPTRGLVNKPYKFEISSLTRLTRSSPRWKSSSKNVELTMTRWQPQRCRRSHSAYCNTIVNLNRFASYEWDGGFTLKGRPEFVGRKVICPVGASHAERLRDALRTTISNLGWGQSFEVISGNLMFPDKEWPKLASANFFQKCHYVILGYGQWLAGWPSVPPYSTKRFAESVEWTIERINLLSDKTKVIWRSMHYNPLGDKISSCPPQDWRSPPVVDAYNNVLRNKLAKGSSRLMFVDTTFIIGPMWDSAKDWCHYVGKVGKAEAKYFLHVISKLAANE